MAFNWNGCLLNTSGQIVCIFDSIADVELKLVDCFFTSFQCVCYDMVEDLTPV